MSSNWNYVGMESVFLSDEPIRGELFSLERLEQHAESLAAAQDTSPRLSTGYSFLRRVKDNRRLLSKGYRHIADAMRQGRTITPAAEWLIDNFHIVEEQVREIIDDLPPGFYRELPKLASGPLAGLPRTFGVAWAYIAHTDSRFDPDWLRRFVIAYQRTHPLLIGEVWALAINLRIVLIENLRRLTERILHSRAASQEADELADALLGLRGEIPANVSAALARFEDRPLARAFAVQLLQRLRDQEGRLTAVLRWLDSRLTAQQTNADEMIRLEHQELSAMNTSVRNIITSMRLFSTFDWAQFFEDVAAVDTILRAKTKFAALDFSTRDRYRHAIEELARGSRHSEVEITHRVIQVANDARARSRAMPQVQEERLSDPGYYLISKGRLDFEKEIHYRIPFRQRFRRAYISHAAPAFIASLTFFTSLILAIPLYQCHHAELSNLHLIMFGLLGFFPASDLAVAIVNNLVTHSIGPQALPKMDFRFGVPESHATLVVIPTLLTSTAEVLRQIEQLEIHYLSNSEGHLQFALLTDWTDALSEKTSEDAALFIAAKEGIVRLNGFHPQANGEPRFFLFHRRRQWNAQEGAWIGWERKRGKLHELNLLLRGSTTTSFVEGTQSPKNIRYVLTLDADTRLSRGTAYQLVGAMAHPLNRPHVDARLRRVTDGYGILQPRITATLPTAGFSSLYQETYSGAAGIDPYAFAVSDVYQDLFKEGSYVGKGIYDVDAFESALAGRAPENTLLSHDLFEGLFARAALASDIELFEEFPSHYEVSLARTHRWVRGDWQLIPWLIRPGLTLIERWKIADNLRRSLGAPSIYALLVVAWISGDLSAKVWTLFVLSTLALPLLFPLVAGLWPRRRQVSLANHWRDLGNDFETAGRQLLLSITFIAHTAWVMGDAIGRVLYRLLISRRRLLEWKTAALSKNLFNDRLWAFYQRMASALFLTCVAGILVGYRGDSATRWITLPFLFLWAISPWMAQRLSKPMEQAGQETVSEENRLYYRRLARKTWRFFETFATEAQHHLPPDNFQEIPEPVVAHRTSPTNIGLYLLSVIAAQRFGWIGLTETFDRLEKTLSSIQQLKRFRGHLFNWYDTQDLHPLEPLYVSTVDSGNFAGHLWALAETCRSLARSRDMPARQREGLEDTIALIAEAAAGVGQDKRAVTVTGAQLDAAVNEFRGLLRRASANAPLSLSELATQAGVIADIARTLALADPSEEKTEILPWAELLIRQVESLQQDDLSPSAVFLDRAQAIVETSEQLVQEMQFDFLLDPVKKLFSIGYQVADQKLDPGCYDLLASEARLASFVAIAKGDIPARHWFHLGRALTPIEGGMALLSWSGSMFEYLMPSLVMQPPVGSLIDQTCRRIVRRQIRYGAERNLPWGVSESGYNVQDLEFTYQYNNFGVPGLGLKRGLSADAVIAPYAVALAALVQPAAAAANLRRLSHIGAEGNLGFYEALDFTPSRLPEDTRVAVVRQYMAHHQGMSILSLANLLFGNFIRERFHAHPKVQATELLLQERTPRDVAVVPAQADDSRGEIRSPTPLVLRRFDTPQDVLPRTQLLSNGRYSVMITAAGSGYSRWKQLAVTRWREDTTRDAWGTYLFLRDADSGQVWSAGFQPSGAVPDSYQVDFSEDRAEIIRHDGSLTTTMDVIVSPEDDAEIRRLTLKNSGEDVRDIEVTSYAEMVLAPQAADLAHPAFSNLFVQTEYLPQSGALLCNRRPRSPSEAPAWAAHVMVSEGTTLGELEYESDRSRFLGRGRGVRTPMCVIDGKPLSNTAGAVIDPIVSLRRRLRLQPGETAHLLFTTLVAPTREAALILADKYHDFAIFERTAMLAWTQAHVEQHHLSISPSEAHLFQDIASRILFCEAALRPARELLERNKFGAPHLWAYGISGDLPIVLVRIDQEDDRDIVREMLRAYHYWRMKNLAVDLVILNEKGASYIQELQTTLESLVHVSQERLRQTEQGIGGNIYVLRSDQLSSDDRILLLTAARMVFLSRQGTLAEQLERLERSATPPVAARLKNAWAASTPEAGAPKLEFFNGLGGFANEGREYVIQLAPGQWTPAPWINVISNDHFGFQVSESGSGYTWSVNSRENQLTPWSNDPVSDPCGETFYIRDEETGDTWTPTVLPIREEVSSYTIRHGQGYSRFEYTSHGIASELLQFVPVKDSVKISRLRLKNLSRRPRRLSVTAFNDWVLGTSRATSVPFIITEMDSETGALLARNPWNVEFSERVAFACFSTAPDEWTADRTEFIGRNGTLDHAAAIEDFTPLSARCGAGWDPCAALRNAIELKPGAQVDVLFFLGQADNRAAAIELIRQCRQWDVEKVLQDVNRQWSNNLEAVQVRTPDRAMDLMLNRWLLYQTLACRLYARSAFYQAGGAYGFRDQLQDVLALTVSRRDLSRAHILRAAARQFVEGDVQHWWHPPSGRGVRTKISDDLIWLPFVVNNYLEVTGDATLMEESVPFLEGPAVEAGREDAYFHPSVSAQSASLYEHCARALDSRLQLGPHGLPLMGTGDWNDGMNRIGAEGKGESVWLAWFLHTTLWEFAKIADARGDTSRAEKWRLHVAELKASLERHGWDGAWYRRAFFDDGSPVGSAGNAECRIDSIAQSWAVLSGAADPTRAARAMAAVEEYLVRKEDKLLLLFTPPFNQSEPSPGYIQGYLPGVRENGGQYTHAAVWSVLAFAALGDGNKATELFSMLNPIMHSRTRVDTHRYKVEPYVTAGDCYAEAPHVGRGGWTWYTGSSGWLYRAGIEWILGFRLRGTTLFMDPCIPKEWSGFELSFRYHSARYDVKVENPKNVCRGVQWAEMDGKPVRGGAAIYLTDDGATHVLRIVLG